MKIRKLDLDEVRGPAGPQVKVGFFGNRFFSLKEKRGKGRCTDLVV